MTTQQQHFHVLRLFKNYILFFLFHSTELISYEKEHIVTFKNVVKSFIKVEIKEFVKLLYRRK